MTAAKTRMLIVDDHPIVRQGLSMLINSQRDTTICAQADNGLLALTKIEAEREDV